MSHRQFTDSTGRTWDVWDVNPTTAARSLTMYSRAQSGRGPDPRDAVAPGLADGWLCFEHGTERRRLAPIPAGWTALSMPELERLRDTASRVRMPGERGRSSGVGQQSGLGTA